MNATNEKSDITRSIELANFTDLVLTDIVVRDITYYRLPDYVKSSDLSFSKATEIPLHAVPSFPF